jgi:hypothetical protein
MKNVILVFDADKGELRVTIENDTLIVDGFQKCIDNKHTMVLLPQGQVKLIKKLTNNLSL